MTDQGAFWSDQIAKDIIKKGRKLVVNTGITPSGQIHVGNLREILTADSIYRSLLEHSNDVEFNYMADNFDPLRKVYPFLDEKVYTQFVGQPISDIPAPDGKEKSYADYFLKPFLEALDILGVNVKVVKNDELYKKGLFNENIIKALKGKEKIRQILHKATGKETDQSWTPFNVICEKCKKMTETKVLGFSQENETVDYECSCGNKNTREIKGGGKLTWRVDWPARWEVLKVSVEPFGKDHASKGGSYDTGKIISRVIFDYEPPYPTVYEWISLKGLGDMSSSKGNVISARDMLDVLPPEVLKYAIIKTKPPKAIAFDPGLPLITLMDEFDDDSSKNKNRRAYEIALTKDFKPVGVPFRHIVSLVQITQGDVKRMAQLLNNSGYPSPNMEALKSRAEYAQKWIDKFAPEEVKFTVQQSLPEITKSLSNEQKSALKSLADCIKEGMTGDEIQQQIYAIKENLGIDTKEIFRAVYMSILGKEQGPRAGMFLAMMDKNFLKTRFSEASEG